MGNSAAKGTEGGGQYKNNRQEEPVQKKKSFANSFLPSELPRIISPRRRSLDAQRVASPRNDKANASPQAGSFESPQSPPGYGRMAYSLSPPCRTGVAVCYSQEQANVWPQYAVSSVQGQRMSMEDDHAVIPKVQSL
jgi:hypothetical protein